MESGNSLQGHFENSVLTKPFSYIYVEDSARPDAETKKILSHFPNAVTIPIKHYKDVFTPAGQNLLLQKKIPYLILARKEGRLIYNGAPVCEDFGNEWFYYTSSVMNCCYDCEYCYLQGMYPSADIVIFTNLDDIFEELDRLLCEHPVYLCISYDTDLLALEGITGYVKRWIEYTAGKSDLTVECRSKSAGMGIIEGYIEDGLKIPDNFIFAWTLSPERITEKYEHNTPGLSMRLASIKKSVKHNISTRICFDPVLFSKDWKEEYGRLFERTFSEAEPSLIKDVSIGPFRISKDYLVKMKKRRPLSALTRFPYVNENGTCSYGSDKDAEIMEYLTERLMKYMPESKIFTPDWK